MAAKKDRISPAVIRRLPRYYRRLTELMNSGVERISSGDLGEAMGLTASQIRQDFSCFGEFGQQGYGYNVERLRSELSAILGMDENHTVIVLGVGNLGRALMENFRFSAYGMTLSAGFDVDPQLIGKQFGGVDILPMEQLEAYLAENQTSVAVLTVPQPVAQTLTEQLSRWGVQGLWNFTNVELTTLPEHPIVIESVHFSDSLLALSYMISDENDSEK